MEIYVVGRLEEAGQILLCLPNVNATGGYPVADVVKTALESYGWRGTRAGPIPKGSDFITRMEEAMSWLNLIPREKYALRRVVGARSLVHPITNRHLFPWRRLGAALGADHKAVQRWHAQGVDFIVKNMEAAR